MPKPYPKEFRDDVVAVARRREPSTREATFVGSLHSADASHPISQQTINRLQQTLADRPCAGHGSTAR